ncbi:MAG TPA: PIN domain-containing protein [Candidatus Saccharimonadales bacterium]|nr:PIN domain-containing protein [Candidatus Saccharimonadales bacterium]
MLIDSNILVYAINADSPKNKTAQLFLSNNSQKLEIAHQNIFESLRVLTHPKFSYPMKPSNAQEALWAIVDACKIVYPNNKTHYLALELIKENNLFGNQIFDAYLAATALSNNITTIATDNVKDFKKFKINILNPF